MALRALTVIALLAASVAVACGGDGGSERATPTRGAGAAATPTRAVATPATTAAATVTSAATAAPTAQSSPAGAVEVTGIVGAVIASRNVIEINRLSGADVREVQVVATTGIFQATGGRLKLDQIRPSDRIVAEGTVDGETLIATRVTVQDIIPGGPPGG